jgi:hypothetical protein
VPVRIGKARAWVGARHSQNTVSALATISYITDYLSGVAAQQWLVKNKLQLITPAFVTHANGASSRLTPAQQTIIVYYD